MRDASGARLEQENARPRKIVADLTLGKEMLQDVVKRKLLGLARKERWSTRYDDRNG